MTKTTSFGMLAEVRQLDNLGAAFVPKSHSVLMPSKLTARGAVTLAAGRQQRHCFRKQDMCLKKAATAPSTSGTPHARIPAQEQPGLCPKHSQQMGHYCNRTNFRMRFNFVYFVLFAESTKFSSIRKPYTYACVSDTTVAVRKFLACESWQTLEYEIFTRTKISAITVCRSHPAWTDLI